MIEALVNPRKTEESSWRMFLVGIVYASLSTLLVYWFFAGDAVLSNYSGIIVVTFSVMFSIPFMYYLINREEVQDETATGILSVWKIHKDAVYAFMGLFFGFIIAFSFWYAVLHNPSLFNAQIETYCTINSPGNMGNCISQYSFNGTSTGAATSDLRLWSIISNNLYVMIFTLIFSLIFGAGAIFILAWNASVIAAAIGAFTQYNIEEIPIGIARYMIHGIPEIGAYFITALAGGIFGVGIIRNGVSNERFVHVLENTFILLFIAIILLVVGAVIEVYLTPLLF